MEVGSRVSSGHGLTLQGLGQEPCIGMGKQDCRQVHTGVPTMVGLGDSSLGVPQMRKSQAIPKSNNKFKDKEDRRPERGPE